MLPKELLETRKSKGRIYPKFADFSKYYVELAEKVISIFKSSKGKNYGSVLTALKKLENARNFKTVRGFAKILENYCIEKACCYADTELNPMNVRMFIFERGFVTSKKERNRVLEYAAKYFRVSVEELEKIMYADREEELIITKVDEIDVKSLIRHYNLSLLQTTIFNCLKMSFYVSSNHKNIFRSIKWNGLMYELSKHGLHDYVVEIMGPASIIKMTRRYGVAMAKVIPHIISAEKWKIEADILDGRNIYKLKVDDRLKDLLYTTSLKEQYDSSLEAEFARRLRNLGYTVIREPDIVKAGDYAFIPDFLVIKNGVGVYVELAGFWTPEYLKRKSEKVGKANIPLVVVANEGFGEVSAKNTKFKNVEVIIFSRKINYGDVIRSINRLINSSGIKIKSCKEVCGEAGEVAKLVEVNKVYDKRKGIGTNLSNLLGKSLSGGNSLGESLLDKKEDISKDTILKIREEIEIKKIRNLSELESLFDEYGIEFSTKIVEKLGYKLKWKGLDAELKQLKG